MCVRRLTRQRCALTIPQPQSTLHGLIMKDLTLGGYLREHERPPAFRGSDGEAYSVELMVEPTDPDDGGEWGAYLFFIRWRGTEPVGHLETDFLSWAGSEKEARAPLEQLTLHDVKDLLDSLVAG